MSKNASSSRSMVELSAIRTSGRSNYTPEMQAEMVRLDRLITERVDFTQAPDAAARKLDSDNNSVWNIDLPKVASIRRLEIAPDNSLDAVGCEAIAYEPAQAGSGLIFFVHGGGGLS